MKKEFIVYCLVDPKHEEIFYIGRSSSGLRRAKHHLQPSIFKKKKYLVYERIRDIKSNGYEPYIDILEDAKDNDELNILEQYYINLYRTTGDCPLMNITSGGSGTLGRKVSNKVKILLSKKAKGRKLSRKTKIKISKAKIGIKLLETTKLKILLHSPKRKSIICVETLEIFKSIRQAAKKYHCDHRGLARCCKGEYKQYINKHWKYLKNFKYL